MRDVSFRIHADNNGLLPTEAMNGSTPVGNARLFLEKGACVGRRKLNLTSTSHRIQECQRFVVIPAVLLVLALSALHQSSSDLLGVKQVKPRWFIVIHPPLSFPMPAMLDTVSALQQ